MRGTLAQLAAAIPGATLVGVDAAFDGWIWPLLGLIFLPFATLIYVILWQTGGLSGGDWFWVGLAALFDIGHWGAAAAQRRMQATATV